MEIWKPVPSNPTIKASSFGRIMLPNGLKPRIGTVSRSRKTATHQFLAITIRKLGRFKVHRLVCEAFHGARPSSDHIVIHANEDALDNRSDNLRWGTQKENLNMPKFIAYCRSRTGENSSVVKGRKF